MESSTKTSLIIVFLLLCVACANCDIERAIERCMNELKNEYGHYSPAQNTIHGLYWLDEHKFVVEGTNSGDLHAYYTYLFNIIEENNMLNTLCPQDYCDTKGYLIGAIAKKISGYNERQSEFVELSDHCNNDVLLNRLKQMCVQALERLGCIADDPGFNCVKHFYLNYDKIFTRHRAGQRAMRNNEEYIRYLDIRVEDLYPNWRHTLGEIDDYNTFMFYGIKIGFIQGYFMKYIVDKLSNIDNNYFLGWREFCYARHIVF